MVYKIDFNKLSSVLNHLPTSAYCIHFPFVNGSCAQNISNLSVQDICDLIVSYIVHANFDLYGLFFSISCYDNVLDVGCSISFSFFDFVTDLEVQDE